MSGETINLSARHDGCKAELFDNGENTRIPVCLGGISIVGCNNAKVCRDIYGERRGRQSTVPVVFEENNTVTRIVTVQRGTILSEAIRNT